MSSNSTLTLTSLDFDNLKNNFVTFLKSQETFKDYNFEGSNMNVLLDVLSYNTFLNSFYLNMVASEMFMDSAQKLDSVVSHAKELNYVPQSNKSSFANVNIVFETVGLDGKFTIPQGTIFTGTNSNGSFTFVTPYTGNFTSSNNTFYCNNIVIYEGSYTTQSFTVDNTIENQRFIIENPNIDLSSLTVNVIEDNGLSNTLYKKSDNLYKLNSASTIFFVQASTNNRYEILFGDGVFGKKPKNGATVIAYYRITNGPAADGINNFQLAQGLEDANRGLVAVENLVAQSKSSSGAYAENIENIRFRAPRWFASQERGVSNDDYASLVISQFGFNIQDINVYGGQDDEPYKQYGSVIISIKPYGSTIIPDYLKNQIQNYLLDKSQMRIIMRDPEYFYLKVNTVVQYDKNKTTYYPKDIEQFVATSINNFSTNNLEKFNRDFRYSRFVAAIDSTDVSITSNQTEIFISYRWSPLLNYTSTISFTYGNAAEFIEPSSPGIMLEIPVFSSSPFTFVNKDGIEYPVCYMRDDSHGKIIVYKYLNNNFTIINNDIGSIDYTNGHVKINYMNTTSYDQYISMYMNPKNSDVIIGKNKILLIDPPDVTIDIVEQIV